MDIDKAHQQQTEISWNSFTHGIFSEKWAQIQQRHYEQNLKDGENIFGWKREVMRTILNFIKELWNLRCGFINAERVLTERDILCRRTLRTFLEHKENKDLIPILDRHLLEKDESYFWKSSTETLVIWKGRMKNVLKSVSTRDVHQPCLPFQSIVSEESRRSLAARMENNYRTYIFL